MRSENWTKVYHAISPWETGGGSFCFTLWANTNCGFHATTEWYKYRRHITGTNWFWTPLGFPGQYYDTETDLIQNWNRFYDPGSGRYMEPEPMYQKPDYAKEMALQGHSVPVYGYSFDTPLSYTDPTGLASDPNLGGVGGGPTPGGGGDGDGPGGGGAGGDMGICNKKPPKDNCYDKARHLLDDCLRNHRSPPGECQYFYTNFWIPRCTAGWGDPSSKRIGDN